MIKKIRLKKLEKMMQKLVEKLQKLKLMNIKDHSEL